MIERPLEYLEVYTTTVASYLHKCKEKLIIVQLIGIIDIKCKETRVITYTYSPTDILVGI